MTNGRRELRKGEWRAENRQRTGNRESRVENSPYACGVWHLGAWAWWAGFQPARGGSANLAPWRGAAGAPNFTKFSGIGVGAKQEAAFRTATVALAAPLPGSPYSWRRVGGGARTAMVSPVHPLPPNPPSAWPARDLTLGPEGAATPEGKGCLL